MKCLTISDALPGPSDQDLYESVDKVLAKTVDILEGLRAYTGATDPIREVNLVILLTSFKFWFTYIYDITISFIIHVQLL